MKICGLQKLSLLDFPGRLCATVFTGGCNLRCPFCHNALLVERTDECTEYGKEEIYDFLRTRSGKLDGVCLTGGEPLVNDTAELLSFLRSIKELGFKTKLDTNGFFPEKLRALIGAGALDYVAMDIKNSLKKYGMTVGVEKINTAPVGESVRLLMGGTLPFEFRTTLVRELHAKEDLLEISRWIAGAPRYFLQGFSDSGDLLGSGFSSFSKEEMLAFKELVAQNVPSVQIRGL